MTDRHQKLRQRLTEWSALEPVQQIFTDGYAKNSGQAGAAIYKAGQLLVECDKAISTLAEDNAELEALFELQRKRERPYIEIWQIETNNPDTWPDYGEFLKWLLDRLEAAEK